MDFLMDLGDKALSIALAFSGFLWSKVLIILLLGVGLYFTVRMKGVQLRMVPEMFKLLFEDRKNKNQSSNVSKKITSFQAFSIGAASRIGTGNIVGVAGAITVGGPGAVFWMWVVAILGGASAFVESTLAQIYKVKDKDGFKGGPGYYIKKQLGAKWLSSVFAVCIIMAFGLAFNSVQSNTIAGALENSFEIKPLYVGIALTVITAVIVFGGVKRIAGFTSKVVPVMAVFYLILAAYIVITNITAVPEVITLIVKSAFGADAVIGGGIGAAIMMGVKRGLFSNEAGMGSAPNAAASAHVSHPVKQGLIQTLGVYFDTLLVCTATAFIILVSESYKTSGLEGAALTQASMSEHIGGWAGLFLAVAIFMFAFSSIIGNYYYGEVNIQFISKSKVGVFIYRVMVLGMVFFGAVASFATVWDLADLTMGLMAIINIIAISALGGIAFKALDNYVAQRKQGLDPVFHADDIDGLKGVECWPTREEQMKNVG